jgi:hypothetical protein
MPTGQENARLRYLIMSMAQLIIGAALGFIIAEGVLYGIRYVIVWLRRDETRRRFRTLTVSRESAFVAGFTRYGALVGASAAIITLGAWAVGDYLAAKSARSAAMANALDPATPVPAPALPHAADDAGGVDAAADADSAKAVPVDGVDPYADPDFKVQHRAHRAGTPASLKETLLERSEAKARAELLRETRQHLRRSQYDCEAADHAARYLKAGLDVWGFAAWQFKYFPADGYKGATLAECRDIKDVLDPSSVDLKSTVAQVRHP